MNSVINSYSNSFKLVIGIYPLIVHWLIKKGSSTGHCQHYYFHCVFIVDSLLQIKCSFQCKKQHKIKPNKKKLQWPIRRTIQICIGFSLHESTFITYQTFISMQCKKLNKILQNKNKSNWESLLINFWGLHKPKPFKFHYIAVVISFRAMVISSITYQTSAL